MKNILKEEKESAGKKALPPGRRGLGADPIGWIQLRSVKSETEDFANRGNNHFHAHTFLANVQFRV